jgi:chromate transport protein ChrA
MWTLPRRFNYAIDGLVGYSSAPLRFATLAGVLLCLATVILPVAHLNLRWHISVEMLLLVFALGIQLIATGIVGEYLWRLLEEVRRRPRFLVDRRVEGGRTNDSRAAS